MWGVGSAENPWEESGGLSQEGVEGYELSQQSMGFSLSQQLGSEIGLSQYELSQSQTGSQGKGGAAAATPICLECQSTEITTTKDGDMVCGSCGTAYEGTVNEVVDVDTGFASGRIKTRHIYSNKEFCKLTELSEDAKAEVNRVASDVWLSYLERLTLPPSCGYSGIHVRDQFRQTWEMRRPKKQRQGDQEEKSTRKPGPINVDEYELKAYGDNTIPWNQAIMRARKVPGCTVPPIRMVMIPAILYICARWMRSPILPVDIVRWIRDGSLPYLACLTRLPESVGMTLGIARYFFVPRKVPTARHINLLADRIAAFLGLELPPLNVPAVTRRLVEGLGMPAPVTTAVETLARFSVGNPSAQNPATAWKIANFGNRKEHRPVGSKRAPPKASENVDDDSSEGDSGNNSRSDTSGSEAEDVERSRKMLREFLTDASPVHAMALVVAAAKGCPGWDTWRYTRPVLLSPPNPPRSPTLGVATKDAGAKEDDEGGSLFSAGNQQQKQKQLRKAGGDSEKAPPFFPQHSGELRLLLRGRLREFLRAVEVDSGVRAPQILKDSWIKSGDYVSPGLEKLAAEIEEARGRQQRQRCNGSSSQGGGSGSGDIRNNLLPVMGTVRAAHVVAGAWVEDTLPLPLRNPIPSEPPAESVIGKRKGPDSSTVEETYDGPRTFVYDPDDEISRFHPQYELLVEACAHYMEVPPYMLQELAHKLDAIIVDQTLRRKHRVESRVLHDNTIEFQARVILEQEGRFPRELVERRAVFPERERSRMIKERFFPHRPIEPGVPEYMINYDNIYIQEARAKGKEDNPSDFFSETRQPPKGGIAIVGGDTLRPPPISSRVKPGGTAVAGGSSTEAPLDTEVCWLLHCMGASDPFVDDEYTKSVGKYHYRDGFESVRLGYRYSLYSRYFKGLRPKGSSNPHGGERRHEKEGLLGGAKEFEGDKASPQGGKGGGEFEGNGASSQGGQGGKEFEGDGASSQGGQGKVVRI